MGFLSPLRWMGRISRPWIAKSIPLNGYTMCFSLLWALSKTCTHYSFHDLPIFPWAMNSLVLQAELFKNSVLSHLLLFLISIWVFTFAWLEENRKSQRDLLFRHLWCCAAASVANRIIFMHCRWPFKNLCSSSGGGWGAGGLRGCQFPFGSFCSHLSPQGKLWLTVHSLTA